MILVPTSRNGLRFYWQTPKMLYNMLGGCQTGSLLRQCSIRQGCPLSPLLFILAVEILALKIRQCSSMQRIKLPGQCHSPYLKIAQYADDTTLFVNSRHDLEEAINIVNNFARFSGLHIKRNKSEGL